MPPKCTICTHKKRNEIDSALVNGSESLRSIAKQYETTAASLKRHKDSGHIHQKIAKAQNAKDATEGSDLFVQVQDLSSRALSILAQAEGTGDLRTACAAIREVRGTLELLLKVSGELKGNQTNVQIVTVHQYRVVKGVLPID